MTKKPWAPRGFSFFRRNAITARALSFLPRAYKMIFLYDCRFVGKYRHRRYFPPLAAKQKSCILYNYVSAYLYPLSGAFLFAFDLIAVPARHARTARRSSRAFIVCGPAAPPLSDYGSTQDLLPPKSLWLIPFCAACTRLAGPLFLGTKNLTQ